MLKQVTQGPECAPRHPSKTLRALLRINDVDQTPSQMHIFDQVRVHQGGIPGS